MSDIIPKVVVFDLDGCVWTPEMYELNGGTPFKVIKNGNLLVKKGINSTYKIKYTTFFLEKQQLTESRKFFLKKDTEDRN